MGWRRRKWDRRDAERPDDATPSLDGTVSGDTPAGGSGSGDDALPGGRSASGERSGADIPRAAGLDGANGDGSGTGATASGATPFAPRPDGDYVCEEAGLYLRFVRPVVTELSSGRDDVATGEFTTAGRFTVQRRFERAVVYTVLDSDTEYFTARRIDTADGRNVTVSFAFRADIDRDDAIPERR